MFSISSAAELDVSTCGGPGPNSKNVSRRNGKRSLSIKMFAAKVDELEDELPNLPRQVLAASATLWRRRPPPPQQKYQTAPSAPDFVSRPSLALAVRVAKTLPAQAANSKKKCKVTVAARLPGHPAHELSRTRARLTAGSTATAAAAAKEKTTEEQQQQRQQR